MRILCANDAAFGGEFASLLNRQRGELEAVSAGVAEIVATVRRDGDAALRRYTERFDRHEPAQFRLDASAIATLADECSVEVYDALAFSAERIDRFHRALLPQNIDFTDALGVRLGAHWTSIDAVGIYVPGGTAAYPSSVLMSAVPARVAGVRRITMAVPTPDGRHSAAVFAAARIAGVTEAYTIGGAQAIAALAYGTESVSPVDKIVGPGNAYVAAAKRLVFGQVGIDTIAGPSEITVVADRDNDPAWIAADLLSQAEHDEQSQAILITDNADFAAAVGTAVETQLTGLPRAATARAAWESHGAIIVVNSLVDACCLVNRIAPEHVELAVADPERLAGLVHHAGAIFLGRWTPETLGDYVGGPNHVLPTSGTARFSSGLGVQDFMKRTSLLGCGPASFAALAEPAMTLAKVEGLEAHACAAALRLVAYKQDADNER